MRVMLVSSLVFNWMGVILLVLGCICLSIIGIRNSVWYGPRKSPIIPLQSFDKRLGVISIICIILSGISFVIGVLG